jgi:hypothetical protein
VARRISSFAADDWPPLADPAATARIGFTLRLLLCFRKRTDLLLLLAVRHSEVRLFTGTLTSQLPFRRCLLLQTLCYGILHRFSRTRLQCGSRHLIKTCQTLL